MNDTEERVKVHYLFITGTWTQVMMAKTASTLWTDSLLKCRDAVLSEMKANIRLETYMTRAAPQSLARLSCFHLMLCQKQLRSQARCLWWGSPEGSLLRKETYLASQEDPVFLVILSWEAVFQAPWSTVFQHISIYKGLLEWYNFQEMRGEVLGVHQVHDEDDILCWGRSVRGLHVLDQLQDVYFKIPIHTDSWPFLHITLGDYYHWYFSYWCCCY